MKTKKNSTTKPSDKTVTNNKITIINQKGHHNKNVAQVESTQQTLRETSQYIRYLTGQLRLALQREADLLQILSNTAINKHLKPFRKNK